MQLPRRLQAVEERLSAGQFRAGLEELGHVYDQSCHADRILMAELLLRTGERSKSETLVLGLIHVPSIDASLKAKCYEHLAYITKQREGLIQSIRLYEKSLRLAERAGDLAQVCRTQLWLIAAKADAYGPDALGTLPSEVAWNVLRCGGSSLRLLLHTTFAEVEGRRGALETALRHIEIALSLLEKHPNLWIEARLFLLRGALAEATSNLSRAIDYTRHALSVACESGSSLIESAAICNLGQLYVTAGEFDDGASYLSQASSITGDVRVQRSAVIDALAQIELLNGRLDRCDEILAKSTVSDSDSRYIDLDNQATRVRCLQRRGNLAEALRTAEAAVNAASERSAHLLHTKYRILLADVLVDLGRVHDASQLLQSIGTSSNERSFAMVAEMEHVEGRIALRFGSTNVARSRFDRASRVLSCIGHVSALDDLQRRARSELDEVSTDETNEDNVPQNVERSDVATLDGIVSAAKLIGFARAPRLLGAEAFHALQQSGRVSRMALLAMKDGIRTVLQHHNWLDVLDFESREAIDLQFGSSADETYELLVVPNSEYDSPEWIRSVLSLVSAATELQASRRERTLRTTLWPTELSRPETGPVFYSERMRQLREQALRMATTDLKVLITGETGVGKEVIARLIHDASKRSNKRFDAVNCASVPRELFEAHLFGHKKGAFTGAINDSLGVIRGNDGGTIFFDEIGELSVDMQVKLLRVLDAQEVHPLGAPHALPVDFRIVAATNADLFDLVEEKRFREDLFYRLNVATLRVPALRERREEILLLAEHFLRMYCVQYERPLLTISDEAREHLLLYSWPGNVRELRNEMERLAGLMESGAIIQPADLKTQIVAGRSRSVDPEAGPGVCVIRLDQKLQDGYDQYAKKAIESALRRHGWNLDKAAKDLGLSRKGLYNMRLRYSLN